jgi:1,4-dihydroxy-2-naphthoyl-CoA hydrolase
MLPVMTTSFDTDGLRAIVPLSATLGIRAVSASAEEVVLELDWREDLCTAAGVLHGGALMSLADTAGAICAVLNLPEGATGTTTVESKTNLLAAVRDGTVTATTTPLKVGRTLIVVETEMLGGDGRLVAKTAQTQAVLR